MSWCVECDAAPGMCTHSGLRYLDPPAFHDVTRDGKRLGARAVVEQIPLFAVDRPYRPMCSQLGPDDPWPDEFF